MPSLEAFLTDLFTDDEKRAELLRIFTWIAMAVTAMGFVIILLELRRQGVL